MIRMLKALVVLFTILGSGLASAGGDPVNYDDPNLAYSNDYASDSAITCPDSLKGKKLAACLAKNGGVPHEEISEGADSLRETASRSVH